MATEDRDDRDYTYTGSFDRSAFQKAYVGEFKDVPKFNLASVPDLVFVLGKIGTDPRISDIRWAAYMLATTFVESSHTVKVKTQSMDKKGKIKSHQVKVWRNFTPIDEVGHGSGKAYYLPVKVKRLSNGDSRLTEYDGDQWVISATSGVPRPLHRDQERGVESSVRASPIYDGDDGDEQYYYGRGYVQLTWWSGYVNAGISLGQGLALLLEPNLVNDPNTAYLIMSTGMYTGGIFANKRRFSQFFHGGHTDYVGARMMVNPRAKQINKVEVAKIAERFEKVIFASRMSPGGARR